MTSRAPASLFKARTSQTGGALPPIIWPSLQSLVRPVEGMTPYPGNARNGDTDLIGESLDLHGQYAPIVYQLSTGHIIKGNHVMHCALERGWDWIAATALDVDDDHARRIVLQDNATSDAGRYDDPLLIALLEPYADLGDFAGTGFTEKAYLDLLDRADRDAAAILDAAADAGGGGLGNPVVSYTLVFDDTDQQNRWYGFLKWLRTSGVPGETIGARIDEYLAGVVPDGIQ